MAEKEGAAVPPQSKGSWSSFLKVRLATLFAADNVLMLTI
jgi:hypothetical protein